MMSGVALFFTFIKSMIIYFLLRAVIVDIFNIITNLNDGQNCEGECVEQFFTMASVLHKDNRLDLINVTDILTFCTIILSMVYFLVFRRAQYKIYCIIDEKNQTEDDYSIFVEDIPVLNFPT